MIENSYALGEIIYVRMHTIFLISIVRSISLKAAKSIFILNDQTRFDKIAKVCFYSYSAVLWQKMFRYISTTFPWTSLSCGSRIFQTVIVVLDIFSF